MSRNELIWLSQNIKKNNIDFTPLKSVKIYDRNVFIEMCDLHTYVTTKHLVVNHRKVFSSKKDTKNSSCNRIFILNIGITSLL